MQFKKVIIKNHLAKKLQEVKDSEEFESLKVQEYKPKVDHGELTWEPEPFIDDIDDSVIDSLIPDKILDIPSPDNKYAGKAAHTPTAKVSRKYSNTVRSFFEE